MFKAKLIENESYYKLRSKQMLLMLLISIPMGILANFYSMPLNLNIVMHAIYILAVIINSKNKKLINSMLGKKLIEIDKEEIRIKSRNGTPQEVITLGAVDKLILDGDFALPQETFKELGKEMIGNGKQNSLIIHKNSKSRKLNFEFDSYYMIEQLKKVIKHWEEKGYNIERI